MKVIGHIHAGNVFVDGECFRLGGYENTLLGIKTKHINRFRGDRKFIDVIMFGRFCLQKFIFRI